MSIGVALVSPVSRGSVVINSTDPYAAPLIDPGFLSSEWEYLALRDGIALAQHFVSAPAWSGYVGPMFPHLAKLNSTELETFIRTNTQPSLHLRTFGLSVIDASIVLIVPAAHTQAVSYAFAEGGADLLKQRWGI
ncbi:hypothetical protein DFH06DRAFT_1465522 [Mycena polygramma]|nr:hypothetical protein DFH06DRAFT_1465522 [Mycena polygramma]